VCSDRFSLLLLEPGEIYFQDFSVTLYPLECSEDEALGRYYVICILNKKLNYCREIKQSFIYCDKNLAITNRSCVSCTHNMLKALIGLNITP